MPHKTYDLVWHSRPNLIARDPSKQVTNSNARKEQVKKEDN